MPFKWTWPLVAFTLLTSTTACLQTRQALRRQGSPAEQKKGVETAQLDEVNQDFRTLYGRVEVVENQMAEIKENPEVAELKMKVAQLETKVALLEESLVQLNGAAKKGFPGAKKKGPWTKGNEYYGQKKWENAILSFEEYRKKYPKGKSYSDATYKIGMSFKNLGMKQDAKAFFKEVVDRYPKSKAAKQAKTQLKKL